MISWISARLGLTPERRRKLWYAPAMVLAMGLMMIRLLFVASLLSVEEFGSFSLGLLVSSTFSMMGCFGLQVMLQRDAPRWFVQGEEWKVAVLTIQACVVAVLLCVVALFLIGVGDRLVAINAVTLSLGILHGLSQQMFAIATVESRSRGDVLRYSLQNLSRSTIIFAAIAVVGFNTNSAVVILVVEATCSLILSAYVLRFVRTGADGLAQLVKLAIKQLPSIRWSVALTLLGSSLYGILLSNGDRWVASGFLSLPEFALYAFGWIVLAIAQNTQAVINAAVFPLVARRFSMFGRTRAFKACASISGGIALFALSLSVPTYFFLKFAIESWYPAYIGVVSIIPIFLLIATLRLSDFWTTFLLICGLERKLILFNTISFFVTLMLILGVFTAGMFEDIGILQVAYMALVINLVFVGTIAGVSWKNRESPAS